jgi:hypothetical protein
VAPIPQTFFLDAGHRVVKRTFGAVTLAELTADTAALITASSSRRAW